MKVHRTVSLAACVLALAAVTARAETSQVQPNINVYQRTLHATAMILTPDGQGSGWVVSKKDKLLLTCQHVVGKHRQVQIVFPLYSGGKVVLRRDYYARNAKPIRGTVVRRDKRHDLALIRADALPDEVGELPLAAEAPDPGDTVHAVGCPGRSQALWVYTEGKVRAVTEIEWTDDSRTRHDARVIESQLPINPGDSGGPLVNDRGQLVGVNQGIHPHVQLMSVSIEESEVKRFLARNDDEDDADARLAQLYLRMARAAKASKDYQKAQGYYLRVIRLDEENEPAWTELAWVCNELKDYDKAGAAALAVLLINDKNADAWREMGYALLKKGDYKRAIEALTVARRLNPDDPSTPKYLTEARKKL